MHMTHHPLRRATALLRRLRAETSGLALIEFAFAMPILLAMGGYGIEISNLALANLRVSQYALNLADNASRVGQQTNLTVETLRESDINDVLQATRLEGTALNLTTYGRVTLSSLENIQQAADAAPVQRIHWQRCIGKKSGAGYDSSYGITATNNVATGTTYDPTAGIDTDTSSTDNAGSHPGSTAPTGMGDAPVKVTAPAASGLMFVEINYDYQSLFGTLFIGATKIHYIASFIVRDKRDFTELYNPTPIATKSTCNLHNA
jgi:Flp pilus assembly protein TadG